MPTLKDLNALIPDGIPDEFPHFKEYCTRFLGLCNGQREYLGIEQLATSILSARIFPGERDRLYRATLRFELLRFIASVIRRDEIVKGEASFILKNFLKSCANHTASGERETLLLSFNYDTLIEDPAELNNINHIVNGFCKIYNTDWEEFNSIISDESKNFTAKAPIVPVGYNPSTRDDSAKQEELRIEKLNNAVKICREKTSDALQSNSGTEMQRKRKLADYCMNNKNSVLDYIQYLLKQFYDQWLLPDGSGERFPYVIDRKYKIDDNTIGNEDVGPRNGKYVDKVNPQSSDIKKSPVINDEWLKISEIITTTEKKYNNNFYKNRYVSINGKDDGSDSVLITDFYTKDKETSSEGGYIKIKNEIYKNDEDLGIKWFKDTENGREQTFDLQLYYKNSTYANSQGGKGCPEMMQEVAKELLKRFNELNIAKEKGDSNKLNDSEKKIINKEIERLENLKTLFMNRYKDVFTANHQQYRFKDYIHDLGIGMDCSGYVTRALVFIMNKLQIPGFEQIKTIGPAYGRLKTNCYGLYNEEYDKKNKGSKIIYTASKNDTFNELYQKIQVGDIEMKDKPGGEFHVRIITEVGTRGDDKVAYYKDHQSSSANGRCGIIETTVVEVAPQNDKTIKVYSEYKKSEGKYYKFARPHVFNDEKQLKKYFKEMLIRTGSNPN